MYFFHAFLPGNRRPVKFGWMHVSHPLLAPLHLKHPKIVVLALAEEVALEAAGFFMVLIGLAAAGFFMPFLDNAWKASSSISCNGLAFLLGTSMVSCQNTN